MSNYAKADTRTQWFQDDYPGAPLNLRAETAVVVIHTTEGIDWPGYNGGANAPNYTHKPSLSSRWAGSWRAHFPDERSSRALRNMAGGVQTNTLNCIQVELVGTCDYAKRDTWKVGSRTLKAGVDYVYWPEATDAQLREVGRFLADMHRRHGLRLRAPKPFLAYGPDPRRPGVTPASYGASPARMTFDEWRSCTGVVGHQHVPENSHGDPGALDVPTILNHAREFAGEKPVKVWVPNKGKNISGKGRLKVQTWNVHNNPKCIADLQRMIEAFHFDVIGLEEASRLYGRLEGDTGYQVFQAKPRALRRGNLSNNGNVVVLVRPGLKVKKSWVHKMREYWKGPKQGRDQDPRVYRTVRVRKDGINWRVGAFHLPFGKKAVAESRSFVRRWLKVAGRQPSIALGDWQVPVSKLRQLFGKLPGVRVSGTGTGTPVDSVMYKNCRLIRSADLGKHSSDHNAKMFVFEKK